MKTTKHYITIADLINLVSDTSEPDHLIAIDRDEFIELLRTAGFSPKRIGKELGKVSSLFSVRRAFECQDLAAGVRRRKQNGEDFPYSSCAVLHKSYLKDSQRALRNTRRLPQ